MYAHVIACTGWTWDYIADHVDLRRLKALNLYWADNPPLHKMVAAYLGVEPLTSGSDQAEAIDSASEYIPVETISKSAFDDLLRQHGLPTGE